MANRLPTEIRVLALTMLVEGSSMRSVSRTLGVSINTVSKLLVDAGKVCAEYHEKTVRDVKASRVQCDEIWAFAYAKERNAGRAKGVVDHAGDVWTWTGIDRDTKLVISWLVGGRDSGYALEFMDDVRARLANRVQLTTDGHGAYLEAVDEAFSGQVDYAQVIKMYGPDPREPKAQRRYSPPKCVKVRKQAVQGNPNMAEASTSHVERHNLTMRMSMRRFTRLTNAFSKKVENHCHALALYFVWYNFCRKHKTLGKTPAQAAGLARYTRDMRWIVGMMDKAATGGKRGPYKTRIPEQN